MDEFAQAAFREREAQEILRKRAFYVHLANWAVVNAFLIIVWAITGSNHPWFLYPLAGWGIFIVCHGANTFFMAHPDDIILKRKQDRSTRPPGDGGPQR